MTGRYRDCSLSVSSGVEEYGWLLILSSWSLSKLKAAEVTRRFSALALYSRHVHIKLLPP
jgi:hypothetical protein